MIPTYNRAATLGRCLEALEANRLDADYEVLAADDGSTDETRDTILSFADRLPIRHIQCSHRGPAAARNRALESASGNLALFINDDTILAPDALGRHLARQREIPPDGPAVIGRFQWIRDDPPTLMSDLLEQTSMVFFYHRMDDGGKYGFRHFWTCNLSLSRARIDAVGGFQEDLFMPALEDLELGFRLFGSESAVLFDASIGAVHDHPLTWEDYCQREYRAGQAAWQLWIVRPQCFEAIFGGPVDEVSTRVAADLHQRFGRPATVIYRSMEQMVNREASAPDGMGSDAWIDFLYHSHLILKRLLFYRGLQDSRDGVALRWDQVKMDLLVTL